MDIADKIRICSLIIVFCLPFFALCFSLRKKQHRVLELEEQLGHRR